MRDSHALVAFSLTASMFALFAQIGLLSALIVSLSDEFQLGVETIGQLSTVSAISWAGFALVLGPFSDRIGASRMVLIGAVIFCASLLGFGFSRSMWMLMVSSAAAGLGGALAGPAILTCVGIYYRPRVHGRMMAVVTAAIPLANLIGVPLLVLVAGAFGWRLSFISLAFLVASTVPLALVALPPQNRVVHGRTGLLAYLSGFVQVFREKGFIPMIVGNTASQAAFYAVITYLAAFLIVTYSLNTADLAPLLSAMAVGQLLGTLAGGPLADRFDRVLLCAGTYFLLAIVGVVFFLHTPDPRVSVVWLGLFMGLHAVSRPAFFSLMVRLSTSARGTVMGAQATSNHLGRALGAAAGGLVLGLGNYVSVALLCLALGLVAMSMYLLVYSSEAHRHPSLSTQ